MASSPSEGLFHGSGNTMAFPLSDSFYSPKPGTSGLLHSKENVVTKGFLYLRCNHYSHLAKKGNTVGDILWKYLIAGLTRGSQTLLCMKLPHGVWQNCRFLRQIPEGLNQELWISLWESAFSQVPQVTLILVVWKTYFWETLNITGFCKSSTFPLNRGKLAFSLRHGIWG